MKKLFGTVQAAVIFSAAMTSCGNDNDHSEATCNYYIRTDSIVYSDKGNAEYDSILRVCLQSMEISGYVFQEHAETNTGSATYAAALCNEQAKTKYDTKMQTIVDLRNVRNKLFSLNDSLFKANNINSADEIGLKDFTVKTSLYNTQYWDYAISSKDAIVK